MLAPRCIAANSEVRSESREGATGAPTFPQAAPMNAMLTTQIMETLLIRA